MTYVAGLVSSHNVNQSALALDIAPVLAILDPDQYPLFSIMEYVKAKKVTKSTKVEWREQEHIPFVTQINFAAGYSAAAVSIDVDDGGQYRANDLIFVPRTMERIRVTAVSTNTLTITRSWGTAAAAALLDDDYLIRIGGVNAEGGAVVDAIALQREVVYTYTQIFKDTIKITRTMANIQMDSGGDYRDLQHRMIGIKHTLDMERSMFFGEYKVDTGTFAEIARSMKGVLEYVTTNVQTDADGILSKSDFKYWLENYAGAHGKGNHKGDMGKVVLVGSIIAEALGEWLEDKQMITNENLQKLGMQCTKFQLASGKVFTIVNHNLMNQVPELQGMAICLDPTQLSKRFIANSDTKLSVDLQSEGGDYILDQYLTECCLQLMLEKNHAVLKGVTSYSV